MGAIKLPPTISGSSSTADLRDGYMNPMRQLSGAIYARVISVDWYAHTISCVGMYNQQGAGPWYDVPVISSTLTQNEGIRWLPSIADPNGTTMQDKGSIDNNVDAVAVIDFISGDALRPICLGFIHVSPHEFSFGEEGTKLERHNSGIYTRTTKEGTYEFSFPCGSFVKVAAPEEVLTLKDLSAQNTRDAAQRPWVIPQDQPRSMLVSHITGSNVLLDNLGEIAIVSNTGSFGKFLQDGSVSVSSSMGATLSLLPDGEASLLSPSGALLRLLPDGSVILNAVSSVSIDASSSVSISGASSVSIGSSSSVSIDASTVSIGSSSVSISASSGSVSLTSGSVSVSGISLASHTHQYSNENGTQSTTGPQ